VSPGSAGVSPAPPRTSEVVVAGIPVFLVLQNDEKTPIHVILGMTGGEETVAVIRHFLSLYSLLGLGANFRVWRSSVLILGVLFLVFGVVASPQSAGGQEPVQPPYALPTQAPPGARYVGPATCARCHPSEAETQSSTPMAHALELVADCTILRAHPELKFRNGPYSYQVERRAGGSTLTVTNGQQALSEPLLWAFGQGQAGQTYVFKHEGSYYESRVSPTFAVRAF
jgi:hypothetical protein